METRGSESEDKQARQTKFNEDREEGDALVITPATSCNLTANGT
jgi:hypothetical protein